MKVVPLGVRGSTPAPGPEYVRYGGHTSCVAVFADGEASPRVVLDAGTGLRALSELLAGAPYRGPILLTHLHWDHVQGLPFSRAVDHCDAQITLFVPVADGADGADGTDAEARLAAGFSPPNFPIRPRDLQGRWTFLPLRPGAVDVAGLDATQVAPAAHKGGDALAIRVELDGRSLAYLPDHALADGGGRDATLAVVRGADLLVHDGQFVDGEEDTARAYGHATVAQAMRFADDAAVGALLLTHHAPERTDIALDELAGTVTRTPHGRPVAFAMQDRAVTV